MSQEPRKAWICPLCKRGVAPGVTTCDHGGSAAAEPAPPPRGPAPLDATSRLRIRTEPLPLRTVKAPVARKATVPA